MQEDTIAIGFITTKSDAVLLRIVSGTSNDYIEMYIVRTGRIILCSVVVIFIFSYSWKATYL